MPKAVKVKRYKNIYKRRTPLSILLRIVCIVVVIGLLGFIGWSAYEPVRAYLDSIAFEWKNNPTPSLPEICVSRAGSTRSGIAARAAAGTGGIRI